MRATLVTSFTPGGYSEREGQWSTAALSVMADEGESTAAIIRFQDGPVQAVGVNGVQTEDVLEILINRLIMLNKAHPSRHNALAITKLEEARMWLEERTRDREQRGVEGTNRG